MGNSAEPFLQSCIVQPQMTRDGIHAVFSGQFNCSLPHRIRQSLSPWLGATNLIQLELELRDRLRNDCCAHATRPRPLFGGSTKVPGRVSDRHACLPETHRVRDLDMENMLLTLDGKGRKQRIIPFSFSLRKALHRFIADFDRKPDSLLFATRENTRVNRMTALRGVK